MREKLIEILRKPIFPHELVDPIEAVADYLLDSGVTVQQWIPVTERLPEDDVLVLCIGAKGGMFLGYPRYVYKDDDYAYTTVPNARGSGHATHWMPLPQAPKGE